jgi:hypothetical protein
MNKAQLKEGSKKRKKSNNDLDQNLIDQDLTEL